MGVSRLYPYPFAIPGRPGSGSAETEKQWELSQAFMDKDLAASGLEYNDLFAYPLSIALPRYCDAAYVIPYYDKDGNLWHRGKEGLTACMHRVSCHYPDTLERD